MKKVVITGSSGMLGKDLVKAFVVNKKYEIHGLDINKSNFVSSNYYEHNFDITNFKELNYLLNILDPEIIIHAAAIVNLKICEENYNLASKLNIDVSRILAKRKAKVIYISTDSIFSGHKGNYSEQDIPDPLNNYAKTKYLGELAVRANNSEGVIIRTNIFGYNLPLRNSFAEWALMSFEKGLLVKGYRDVVFNAIYTKQLAEITMTLLQSKCRGIINVGSFDSISKYEFLKYLGKESGYKSGLIKKSSINDNPSEIIRPKNTSLDVTKVKKIIKIPSIFNGIDRLLSDYNREKKNERNKIR